MTPHGSHFLLFVKLTCSPCNISAICLSEVLKALLLWVTGSSFKVWQVGGWLGKRICSTYAYKWKTEWAPWVWRLSAHRWGLRYWMAILSTLFPVTLNFLSEEKVMVSTGWKLLCKNETEIIIYEFVCNYINKILPTKLFYYLFW